MKAPVTSSSVSRFGYPGNSKTADRKKFTERYYEWTRKTLEGKYGRVDHAEDAFNDLINDILKTRGIHRNERNRGYKFHTLIINRAKGCFWRIAAKVWNKAHVRYVESEQALGQPSRNADAVEEKEELENEVLHIAYALLSDDYKSLPYYSRFDPEDLLCWRIYVEEGCSGKATALREGCSESTVSRAKKRVGLTIIEIARENIAARERL